jgi:hypothetical protein
LKKFVHYGRNDQFLGKNGLPAPKLGDAAIAPASLPGIVALAQGHMPQVNES